MKNTVRLFFFLLLLLNTGCREDRGKPVIPKDKMVSILVDVHLTQAIVDQDPLPLYAQKEYYYCNIFERHGVTEALFDSAMVWYASNMGVFEEVYVDVIANLEQQKKALEEEEKNLPDSKK